MLKSISNILDRTSIIAATPSPLMEKISCYLRPSLGGNILSAIHMIYMYMIYIYIQQRVLGTKSSHIKIPTQVSLIDRLVFKQQKTI